MEYLDILNAKGEKTGETVSHDDAHKLGTIHKTVHVWIINQNGEILLQKRGKSETAYPSHWDISASGHVSAGQTSLEAAQRETQEELNLHFPESAFTYLFEREEHIVINNGTYINNEFQDIYLVRANISESDIQLKTGEVETCKFLPLRIFEEWTRGNGELMVPHDEEYKKLIERLKF